VRQVRLSDHAGECRLVAKLSILMLVAGEENTPRKKKRQSQSGKPHLI